MKVGTLPTGCYYVKDTPNIRGAEISTGDRIVFREQAAGTRWERGVVWGMSGDMPLVERM